MIEYLKSEYHYLLGAIHFLISKFGAKLYVKHRELGKHHYDKLED